MNCPDRCRYESAPDMHLEDAQAEINQFLDDIYNGRICLWDDDHHADVQNSALDLMDAMDRLRRSAKAFEPDTGPAQEQRL